MRKWTIAAAGWLLAGSVGLAAEVPAWAAGNAAYSLSDVYSQPDAVPAAKPVWTVDLGAPASDEIVSRAAAAGDTVVVAKTGGLAGISLKTGRTLWTYAGKFQTAPQAANGSVYAATADGRVVKLNASTGKRAWISAALPNKTAANLLVDGDTVVATDGTMTAIDAATGKIKWTNKEISTHGTPRVYGGMILQPTWESGAITISTEYAVDRQTGKTLWQTGSDEYLGERNGMLYYRNTWPFNDGTRYGVTVDIVDPATGKVAESRPFLPLHPNEDPLGQYPTRVVMDGDDLYVQAVDGTIARYDLDGDGTAAPSWTVFNSEWKWIAGPYDGRLFFANADASGYGVRAVKLIDRTPVYYGGVNNPVSRLDLIGSGLYVAQTDGAVYAVDLATGKAAFRYQTASRDFGPFQAAGGLLLVQAKDKLYAFAIPAALRKTPPPAAAAAGTWTRAQAALKIDGAAKTFQPAPMMMANRLFVPLRSLFEAVGAEVAYDAASQAVTVSYRDRTFTLKEGAAYATVGGQRQAISYAPANLNGSVYVPLRDVGGLLGVQVEWDNGTRTAVVNTQAAAQ